MLGGGRLCEKVWFPGAEGMRGRPQKEKIVDGVGLLLSGR